MGTRADFYIGELPDLEWLGSVGWDGYPEGIDDEVKRARTEEAYRAAVTKHIASVDGTTIDQGWPWPWGNSGTTDYAYVFYGGKVSASAFGHALFDPLKDEPEDDRGNELDWPDMTAVQNVTFGRRSGLIVLGNKGEVT